MLSILKLSSTQSMFAMIKDTSTSHERKRKGKVTQDKVEQVIKEKMPEIANSISTAAMSAHGEDIVVAPDVREQFPFSIECKQDERGCRRVYKAFEQAQTQAAALASDLPILPIAVIQQENQRPLVTMDLEHWADLVIRVANTNKEP